MIETLIQKRFFPIVLFFFAFGLFVVNNGNINIYILDEAKNSECAREMFEQGEVFKPTFNYNLRKDKPPLHYFFMMISYSLFGVNAWAARFFSAVFGALTILISFLYTKKFLSGKAAFYTAAVLLASIHLNIQFHLAVPDPYLIFFFCWSLFLFYSALKTGKISDKILLYVAIGLAALTKGPVAIGLAGLVFFIFLILSKQFKWGIIRSLYPFAGTAIVLIITLPWFIVNGLETNWEWTNDFFMRHNLQRFGSEMEGHGGIFLVTFLFVLIGMFPFSFFIFPALPDIWKNKGSDLLTFCLVAASVVILFFSVSQTKLPNYTVPAYPFLAIMIAGYISRNPKILKVFKPFVIATFVVVLILPAAGYFVAKSDPSLVSGSQRIWWLLVLPAGALVSSLFLKKLELEKSFLTLTGSFILGSILIFAVIFPPIDRSNPVRKSLHLVEGREVAYYKKFNASYSFYLRKKIPELEADELNAFFEKNPGGVVISIKKEVDKIVLPKNCEVAFSSRDLLENPTTVLITQRGASD